MKRQEPAARITVNMGSDHGKEFRNRAQIGPVHPGTTSGSPWMRPCVYPLGLEVLDGFAVH
jgi:hypothetical protein